MPQLKESVQFSDDAPRCPNCGKRASAEMATCPACGHEFVPHRTRARCRHCGNRIPADAAICPRCGADRAKELARAAHPGGWRVVRIGAIVLAVLLVACCGWIVFRAITTTALTRALGLIQPTRVPTQVIQVIYVVVTPVSPTAQLAPTRTLTPTLRLTLTPTRRALRTPTPSVTPTGPTPVLGLYPAPRLSGPADTTVYNGADAVIVLEWQTVSAGGLRENEWYAITISFVARDGARAERKGFSKETRWTVPGGWYNDVSSDTRLFRWNVAVVRIEGVDPLASPSRVLGSPNSAPRTFIWNP